MMTQIYADLHNHTTASDGSLTPAELVRQAHKSGLKAVGVTDHDTVKGLNEALETGSKTGIEVITGMEVTIRFNKPYFTGSLHLLVYFDQELLKNDDFMKETADVLSLGRGPALVTDRVNAINREFSPTGKTPELPRLLFEKDIYCHGDRISRRHFALALNDMGLKDRQSVSVIIGNDSPAYIPSGIPADALESYLQKWPLAKIIAHPAAGSYPGKNLYREVLPPFEIVERLLPVFMGLGLDGFEVEYPGHTEEWKKKLRQCMKDNNLVVETGGSDCHDLESRPIGVCGVSVEALDRLRRCYTSSKLERG
ncbi:PHP domain-containing protein [bacterium]|nr:PHP domain-containing protein [bacterium]